MAAIEDAQKRLGELFVIGFEGKTLSDDTSAFISQAGIGGVIYFSRNYESPAQIAELSNQVQECRRELPLWICVDQEGGQVQRFKSPFLIIPSADKIGKTNSPKGTFELAEVIGKELKAVGVNVNFAPVADINTNPNNPNIGAIERTFSNTEVEVSKFVTAMVRGQIVSGIQPCVKHFPGLGHADKDTHLELPKINLSAAELRDREIRPFVRAFKSRCAMVMVCHAIYPQIDAERPASLSPKIIQDILRKDLRYSRIVFSDDMEMDAVTKHFGEDEIPIMAIKAGCDILIYRSENKGRHAYTVLNQALEDGKLDPKVVLEASDRIREIKKETLADYEPCQPTDAKLVVGCEAHQAALQSLMNAKG